MQLNGISTTVMAASEPPEPPPRNPDKINASLKQLADQKSTGKSLDISDKAPKLFKSILSLDSTGQQQQSVNAAAITPTSGARQFEKSPTTDTAATSANNQSTSGELRGAASTLFSAATSTISNKINELVNGSIAITGGGIGQYTETNAQATNRNETKTVSNSVTSSSVTPLTIQGQVQAQACTTSAAALVTVIEQNMIGDGGSGGSSNQTNNTKSAGDYANGDTLNSIDQKNLVFPNESATVFVERRQSPSESGSGSRKSREFDELGK